MKNSVSKSVLAIVATGILLTVFVAWVGLRSPKTPAAAAASEISETPAVAAAEPRPALKPAAAVARKTSLVAADRSLSVIPISLTNVIDAADAAWFQSDAGMKALPSGTQVFGGIEFWLQGAIHLQGLATRDNQHKNFRTNISVPLVETNFTDGKVSVSERGKNIACVYLLGGTRFSTQSGEKFADMLWHYADGTAARSEILYNVHLRDWWRSAYEDPAQLPSALTKVAWQGLHPARKTGSIRLYRVAFLNPHPEKTIRSLEFASVLARPSLFVAALTLDPLMPGARPDNLTSQEMADPELGGHLQLLVQDSEGRPLPDSKITVVTRAKGNGYLNRKFTTDAVGTAQVSYPDTGLDTLDVSAEHEGFSGKKMLWDVSGGDQVPASHTLKLGDEVKIGGWVVNEEGDPVSDAEIRLYRFWRGDDGPDKRGEQAAFGSQTRKTDASGHWQAGGLPAALLANIGFEIKHPGYLGTNDDVGNNATIEKQLREGTYKTVLKRGLIVRGRVLDASGDPVSSAKVWSGKKYYRERQQTSADSDGRFLFNNVNPGEIMFSVMANGYSAASKTVLVRPDMAEIEFRLSPAGEIRGHVQDESGQPLSGVWLGLSGSPGDASYDVFEFTTTTDGAGNFVWDSAPAEPMKFDFQKEGYERKDDISLTPNQDNLITLHRSRSLQGLVLDDATEKPVGQFTIRVGTASPVGDDVYGVVRYKSYTAADGRFQQTLESEKDNAVLVMAEGYADKMQRFPEAQGKDVQVIVRLKPAQSLSGVVLGPDGRPVAGANVTAAGDGSRQHVQLTGGRLRSYDSQTRVATTDEQGHFKLGSVPDEGLVVAAGEAGFARVPLAEAKNNPTITLQAWGRIEGVLRSGGQPAAGKDLLFTLQIPGIGTDFNGFKSTTDDQGQFTMEKIPPGEGSIVRLIQTSKNSWAHSDSTTVQVKSGETTQVTLGDQGALIMGRFRYGFQPTNETPLNVEGHLASAAPMPDHPEFKSPEEARVFYQSPEWQAAMKLRKNYSVEVKADGTFSVDNVVPGEYSLNLSARPSGDRPWQYQPVANGFVRVTVPESFSPTQPVDAGEVLLNALPPPATSPETIWR